MPIQFKRTTKPDSSSAVAEGQPAVLMPDTSNYRTSPRLKIGDGTKTFDNLPWATPDADIYTDGEISVLSGGFRIYAQDDVKIDPSTVNISPMVELNLSAGDASIQLNPNMEFVPTTDNMTLGSTESNWDKVFSNSVNVGSVSNATGTISVVANLGSSAKVNYNLISSRNNMLVVGPQNTTSSTIMGGGLVFNGTEVSIWSTEENVKYMFSKNQGLYPSKAASDSVASLGSDQYGWESISLGNTTAAGTVPAEMKISYNNDTQAIEFISL